MTIVHMSAFGRNWLDISKGLLADLYVASNFEVTFENFELKIWKYLFCIQISIDWYCWAERLLAP